MSHKENDHNKNNFNKNLDTDTQNEKRIDQLLDLEDKYVRTERHLEQHSDIARPEAIEHSLNIQSQRKEEIDNLKNIISHGKHVNVDEEKNLERNIKFTDSYLKNNSSDMEQETLQRTEEKQRHRKEQLDSLQ